ncbi:MAG TPA: hypothetical protein VGR56_00635 [Nitrososphaerales archaeon]|nr:hypothetical protein [Nitrososphaerales archaeon]
MLTPSLQAISVLLDPGTVLAILLLWFLIVIGIAIWFDSSMKRIARTLEEIKKQLRDKSQAGS